MCKMGSGLLVILAVSYTCTPKVFIIHCISDLFDWSKSDEKFQVIPRAVSFKPGLRRQNSKTGALVSCNEQQIAVFRYHNRVYAIKEKCPHLGNYMY